MKCFLVLFCFLRAKSKEKEKESVEPVSEKKKVKEEKEDEKVEDVSSKVCFPDFTELRSFPHDGRKT